MTSHPQSRSAAVPPARRFSVLHPVRWLRQVLQSLAAIAAIVEGAADDVTLAGE